ncbi:MAG TPA: PP2C family protein-serine/threonine phosphatase, partial [Chloroflexia bacterium]|nr:PP2C family protein-serine/threonine phosphatase [Chloroflexia bacterium]
LPSLEIAAICQPARETSGDSYDLLVDESGSLHVVVSDACGKSVPAALLVALSRNTLRAALLRTGAPAAALTETNGVLTPDLTGRQFVAISCAAIARDARSVRIANAGQVYPALARPGTDGAAASCAFLETPGPRLPVGVVEGVAYEESTVPLQPGDLFVCGSDGVIDAARPNGEPFGFDRLAALLCTAAQASYSADRTLQAILDASRAWADADIHPDDITLVVVRVRDVSPG